MAALRWLLVLPVALVVQQVLYAVSFAIGVETLGRSVFAWFGAGPDSLALILTVEALASWTGSAFAIPAGVLVAPSHRRETCVALVAVFVTTGVVFGIMGFTRDLGDAETWVGLVAHIVGTLSGAYYIFTGEWHIRGVTPTGDVPVDDE